MPMSNYLSDALLNAARSAGSVALFGNGLHMALLNASPGPGGGVAQEISGTDYARVKVDNKFAASSGGYMVNNATVSFATAGGSWGRPTYFGIYADGTTGTMLWYGAIASPATINPGDVVHFHPGNLTIYNRLV